MVGGGQPLGPEILGQPAPSGASKIALRLNKVCYKVFLCENCPQHSCKAFIGLTNHAKMIGGGDFFYLKFCLKVTALDRNSRFSISVADFLQAKCDLLWKSAVLRF